MEKVNQEVLKKLRDIKQTAIEDLKANNFKNYKVKNVIHYNEKVELVNKKSSKKEEFDLYLVVTENSKPEKGEDSIFEIEYLEDKKGKVFTIADLIREYEGFENIKDVVGKTQENEKKTKKEQNEEQKKDNLEELEEEKENDLTGKKPKYVIQTIDIDKAYIDNWTTVRRGFDLPVGVEQIAIANPMQKDENVLSSDMTIYMLDANGNIIQDVNGKNISDFFKIDSETGKNPMKDKNTKLELDGYAESNEGQTMRRFKSKVDPNLYLSAEQKRIGDYVQVYAGKKTMDGNASVEVQLETRNVGVQTSLEMQKIISGYKGIYNVEDIHKEADKHIEHGDDEEKIAIENADGDENTVKLCDSPYIPGTEKTWEELSDETGESITKLQERFERELERGKEPKEILDEIEYDYGMIDRTRDRI